MTNLERLNTYRQAQGLDPIAAWRPARHQPMLDKYNAAAREKIENGAADDTLTDEPTDIESDPLKDAIASHDFASSAISEAAKVAKVPPYKTFARYTPSCVDSPCAFIHQFLTEHPDLTRKQAMHALAQYGINFSTARTQYQKWFAARPAMGLRERQNNE